MHVQLSDSNGQTWVIDSDNPALIGQWFSEIIPKLRSNIPALALSRLYVTGTSSIPQEYKLTSSDLVSYYLEIKKAAEMLLELELQSDATS